MFVHACKFIASNDQDFVLNCQVFHGKSMVHLWFEKKKLNKWLNRLINQVIDEYLVPIGTPYLCIKITKGRNHFICCIKVALCIITNILWQLSSKEGVAVPMLFSLLKVLQIKWKNQSNRILCTGISFFFYMKYCT